MRQIAYSKSALKTLGRVPTDVSALIRSKIEQFAADPGSLANNVIALQGVAGVYRLRVGDWRILFTDDGEIVASFASLREQKLMTDNRRSSVGEI